jgi:hypothetical protein
VCTHVLYCKYILKWRKERKERKGEEMSEGGGNVTSHRVMSAHASHS